MTQRVYCSGYWPLHGNKKYAATHYERLMAGTFDLMQGQDLVFFSDDQSIIDMAAHLANPRDITFRGKILALDALPGWAVSERLVTCCAQMKLDRFKRAEGRCREKGVRHYWRDFKGSGPEIYRRMLAIWMSKVALTSEIAQSAPEDVQVAWVDVSIARFNGQRSNWDFSRLDISLNALSHYQSTSQFCGQTLPLNASFLSATAPVWAQVQGAFEAATQRALEMPYGHDEETILGDCVRETPDLFHCLGTAYDRATVSGRLSRAREKIKARFRR